MPHQTQTNPDMQSCIAACTECHNICLQMAMTHCLQLGASTLKKSISNS